MSLLYSILLPLGVILLASCGGISSVPQVMTEQALQSLDPMGDNRFFQSYSPRGKAVYARSWTRAVDVSGVSWNTARTATLVSPEHVVMAKHFSKKVGDEVNFHTRSGEPVQRFLVGVKKIEGPYDVAVGKLNLAVPAGVRYYGVPQPGQEEALLKRSVVTTDHKKRAFHHVVRLLRPTRLVLGYPSTPKTPLQKSFIVGDSGNPTFYCNGGAPILIETHYFGGAGSGPYYGEETLINQINAAMISLGGGYRLKEERL